MNLALTIRRVSDAGAVLECVRRGWSVALRATPADATSTPAECHYVACGHVG